MLLRIAYATIAPYITIQPVSTEQTSGGTATLTVAAAGTAPLSYQWYQGSAGITTNPVGTNSDSFTTPPLTAPASYWVRVSNSAGQVDSAVATVSIAEVAPNFTSAILNPALISGTPFSTTLTASGFPAATFSVQSGSLPPGLTLDATTGALTGTPTILGSFSGVFAAANSQGTANQAFSFTVNPPPVAPAFTSSPLALTLLTGSPYSATLTASGNPVATFSVSSGSLPLGLSLNSTSGALSGAPTSVGSFSGVFAATNSQGTVTQAFSFTVNAPLAAPAFTNAALSRTLTIGTPFSASLTASGNPVASFTLQSGALPPGLSFLAGSGVVNGTPTTTGNFSGIFAATNSQGTATQSFNFVVQLPPAVTPAFTNVAINSTVVRGMEFAATLSASGNPAATFSVQSGALPSGLFLDASSGQITGSPTTAGTFSGVFAATNAGGTATQTFNIVVNAPLATTAFSSPALSPALLTGVPFSATLFADGRPSPTFSLQSGALPPGLNLASGTGILSGIPTVAGSYSGVFSASNGLGTATQVFSFTVTTQPSAPVFSSATLSATLFTGAPISHTLGASGNPAPSYSLQTGTLPTGLVLNPSTGALTGIPTTPGTFTGVFAATNALGTATQAFTYTISSPVGTSAFTNAAINATLLTGASYSATLSANGLPTPTYSIQSGSLPPGLTLSATSGSITGIPTTAGSFSGVFAAMNSHGSATQAFAFTVNAPLAVPAFTSPALQATLVRGAHISVTLSASGNPLASFSVPSGSLPTGMTLDATTGAISGTPTVVGTFSGVFAASNSQGITTQAFSLTVVAPVATSAFTSPALTTSLSTGIPFSATLAANGIPAPTFSLQSGTLPPGLSLNAGSGAIRGTPTTVGTFSGVFAATNSQGTATQAFSFTVSAPLAAPVFTSPALSTAIFRSSPYSATLTATGNPVATFSVQSGSLPSGLTLSASTGVVSGTPTADGSFTGVVAATNSQGTVTQAFSFNVNPPLAAPVFTSTAVNATFSVGTPYTATLAASGNPVPTFGVQTGTLPPGLTLNATSGLLNGTPTLGGAFSGVFRASNSQGAATQAFSFTVNSPPAFTSPALSTTIVAGSSYSASFGAGGYPAATFSVQFGTLPTGLTLNASTGLLSGTPTALGTFAGVIAASNSQGTATQAFSLMINSAPAFTSPALNTGLVTGTPYSATLTASGNPAATFSVQSGTLPAGVTLNASTGTLSGTPTATGTFSGVFAATNSQGTATQAFSFTVNSVPVFTSPALNTTLVTGTSYSTTLTASGTPTATFSVQSGSLPPGLSLNVSTGVISGTPTAGGTFAGVFAATNAQGSASQAFSFNTLAAPTFTNAALNATIVTGTPFSTTLVASGNPTASFSLQSGTLPTGLSLNATTGALSGTPTLVGVYTGVFAATNSRGTATQAFSFTVNSQPVFTSAALNATLVTGTPYSGVLIASGTPAATYSVQTGSLPAGLSLNSSTGLLSGTPTTAGTFTGVFSATNIYGGATQTFSFLVQAAPVFTSPALGTTLLTGTSYSATLIASGNPAATFSVQSGALPTGITLNPTTGVLSGTPTAAGSFAGVFAATNLRGTATQGFNFTINVPLSAPVFTSPLLSSPLAIGVPYSATLTTSANPAATYSRQSGTLPPGLTLSASTGTLSGTPTALGTYTGVFAATNSQGTSTQSFSFTVNSAVPAVSAGGHFSLVLKADGTVWACGGNAQGQLGTGNRTDRSTPVQVMSGARAISAGSSHSLILKTDGTVWATGYNFYGQVGDGTTTHRDRYFQVMSGVKAVSAGGHHSLFLKTDGSVWATGFNNWGQLGNGNTAHISIPQQVLSGVSAISAGYAHSLFLKNDGSVWASGYNSDGQLGNGNTTNVASPVRVFTGAIAMATGVVHSLVLKADGSAWTTGRIGAMNSGSTFVQVRSGLKAIAAGDQFSLFLSTDGTVWGSGKNDTGQLGNANKANASNLILILSNVVALSAGSQHSLFISSDGTAWASGSNEYGSLGNGTTTRVATPALAQNGIASASAGADHSLLLKSDGTAWASGLNASGQIGNGTTQDRSIPVQVLSGVSAISAGGSDGGSHSLFLKTDGTAWATGYNGFGQLGNGGTTNRSTPAQVLSGVAALSAGGATSLFLKSDGTAWAAGMNGGKYGNGTTASASTPVLVMRDIAAVSAGYYNHSLYLKSNGTAWASGGNAYGQLGNGNTTNVTTAVQVLTGVKSIAAGYEFSLFLKTDGTVWATGQNSYGQLGTGNFTNRSTPVQVMSGVGAISAGYGHSLFLKTDGTAWAAGYNQFGQIGNGSTASWSISTPVQVMSGVSAISANGEHSLFRKTDGSLWVAGNNVHGQLGYKTQWVPEQMATGSLAANQAPTNITLSATTLAENNAANATVGNLSATDPDNGDTVTFALVSGVDSADNAAFSVIGNTFRMNSPADYETKNTYAVRLRATDVGGLIFEKTFTITVTDVVEIAPTNLAEWAANAGLSGAAAAPTATPHNDGVPNLLKYAFNMNAARPDNSTLSPNGNSGLPLVTTTSTGGQTVMTIQFLRRRSGSLVYEAQESTDLTSFGPLAGTLTTTPINSDWERVTVVAAPSAAPRRLLRMRVMQP